MTHWRRSWPFLDSGRLAAWALAAVVLAGGILRFSQLQADFAKPLPPGDAPEYYAMGAGLGEAGMLLDPYSAPAPSRAEALPTAWRGMMYPTFIALTTRWLPFWGPDGVRAAQAGLALLCIALTYLLGARAHSRACGLAAALVLAFNRRAIGSVTGLPIESFFMFPVLLAALALAEWGRGADQDRGGPSGDGIPGRAGWSLFWVGLSLTCRSTLVFVPVLAVGCLAACGRQTWRRAAVLLVCAYAVLLPWTLRNAWHFRAFVPLERHAADVSIFTASLDVPGVLGIREAQELAGRGDPGWERLQPDAMKRRLLTLAAENIRRHPWRYVKGCVKRLSFLLACLETLLGLAGILLLTVGLEAARRSRAMAGLAALAGYWLIIHSLMATSERLLLPLLPVAAVLAGAGACAAVRVLGVRHSWLTDPRPQAGCGLLACARGLALFLYAVSLGFMAHEVWALPAGSGLVVSRAAGPDGPGLDRRLDLLRHAVRRGLPQAETLALGLGADALRAGRPGLAREALRVAAPGGRRAGQLYLALGEPCRALPFLDGRAPALDLAEALLGCGQGRAAAAYLGKVRRARREPDESGRLALLYQRLGDYGSALSVLDGLVRAQPGLARWRSDRGIVLMLSGRRDEAAADFQGAIARDPGFLPAYLSLGSLHVQAGRLREARLCYERALRRPAPPGADGLLRIIRAELDGLRRRDGPHA